MEFELKLLSRSAIPDALEKAQRYRLLNEPWQAESICLDILRVEPANQTALITLLLAITDQFGPEIPASRAREVLRSIQGDYEKAYYTGIICERCARARLKQGVLGANDIAYRELNDAMHWYQEAETRRPAGNDDAILRWNTCARTLMRHPELRPKPEERPEPVLDE
ncbi:MAG: hypothetical protein JOY54_13145 [Acidobacteriaceae bacterium]|nr:hypothetical protein [Acidobacteriaceae bacterium]